MDRRDFGKAALASAAAASLLSQLAKAQQNANPIHVTALIHDNMVMMDLIGPLTVFNLLRADIALVAPTGRPVTTEVGIPVTPTANFDDAERTTDVLFVPGGLAGTVAEMNNPNTRSFLAETGKNAQWVTSVCTGSLLLGAAGLLRGYSATSHWYVRDLLEISGANVKTDRVVEDRNRITGGGVTAGLDFALQLAAKLRSEEVARTIQLVLEYDPHPPFDSGSPERAGSEIVDPVLQRRSPLINQARESLLGLDM